MIEIFIELPANCFQEEYSDHARRITQTVHTIYEIGVIHQYIPIDPLLQIKKFLQNSIIQPENVLIHTKPLSLASQPKLHELLVNMKMIPDEIKQSQFNDWYTHNIINDRHGRTRQSIEQSTATHVFHWLYLLPDEYKKSQLVWDEVDRSISDETEMRRQQIHAAAAVLFSSIHTSVVEHFISDTYAPEDLFGSTNSILL